MISDTISLSMYLYRCIHVGYLNWFAQNIEMYWKSQTNFIKKKNQQKQLSIHSIHSFIIIISFISLIQTWLYFQISLQRCK